MTDAEQLEYELRSIAPGDFGSRRPYIIFDSTLPETLRLKAKAKCVYGYHSPRLDLSFRDHLETLGRWRGRSPAIVVNDGEIHSLFAGEAGLRIKATCLHELSHVLDCKLDFKPVDDTPSPVADFRSRAIRRFINTPIPYEPDQNQAHELFRHGGTFIRVLCHVLRRAEAKLSLSFPGSWAFAHEAYGLQTPIDEYQRLLEPETRSHRGTLSELRQVKPPDGFIEIWKADMRQWWLSREPTKDSTSTFVTLSTQFEMEASPL